MDRTRVETCLYSLALGGLPFVYGALAAGVAGGGGRIKVRAEINFGVSPP